ncbi:MAG TPA: peptidylprolyl isomerase [Stellaceae bacterium]|jgi:peptidyl-prolyl cis-trans isomerase SurA|nr:peptidylprolyl isomerase [Stellaceae bacterium]
MRIAAVVNDEVISVFDLASRIRLVATSSVIPDSPETRQRIANQILRSLIDERLELQEAKKQNVTATDAEIKNALDQIEKQNNMKPGALNDFLKARGIDRGTLVTQLTSSIVWAKLVRRQASQTADISEEEIDDTMKRMKEHANEPQSRVAEIFLAVDSPAQDDEVKRLAERLVEQMHKGARFSAVAQQFSQSATAAVGGDIGWVRSDQLPTELGKEVTQLKPGELSPPIRTTGGYYLLLVVDRRNGSTGGGQQDVVYDIVQVVFPLPASANEAARRNAISEAESTRTAATDCPALLKIGKEKAPRLSSEGKLRASTISPQMHELVDKLKVGQASEPIIQRNGVGVIMICGKNDPGGGAITRDQVADSLLRQRLDTVARRYLRDLRRNAYVDVRV